MSTQWTIAAKRRLRAALAAQLCKACDDAEDSKRTAVSRRKLLDEMTGLNGFLEASFPDEELVVQNVMSGYRPKPDQHTLLVDVLPRERGDPPECDCQRHSPGAYVVKIGPTSKLEAELDAWETCRPEGLKVDLVFLPLHAGHRQAGGNNPRMAIYYGDAHQFLAVERVVPFEEAALGAVLYDHPRSTSVGLVLWELYERIAHLLYVQSFEDDPSAAAAPGGEQPSAEGNVPAPQNPLARIKHLYDALDAWKLQEPYCTERTRINSTLSGARHGPGEFIDPVDYLNSVREVLDRPQVPPTGTGRFPLPTAADVLPKMLRGCAHGDLHGRNILVAEVRGKILWPTLFDYEDMGPCSLLGWDFVKLETELKIRAVAEIFDGEEGPYLRAVQEFERDLGLATEARHHGTKAWGVVVGATEPVERLRQIILEIRHRAAVHLGIERGRPNDWLEEYYFLLACYGVCTVHFGNQNRRQRWAAYVSAGAAAARLNWPRSMEDVLPTH